MKYPIPISVILTCCNSEVYISKAIKSILEQSHDLFELIVINDGSDDGTENVIKKFKDSRILYVKNSLNKGDAAVLNLGISLAKGKYICFMEAEDIASSDRLKIQYSYLEKHSYYGAIGSSYELINEKNEILHLFGGPSKSSLLKVWLLEKNYVKRQTLMIRSHLIKKHDLYFDDECIFMIDYDFVIQALEKFPIKILRKSVIQNRKLTEFIKVPRLSEQKKCILEIRKKQLKSFGIKPSFDEVSLHEKLMMGEYLDDNELKQSDDWLKKLFDKNKEKKKYSNQHLYNFFENKLKLAVYNNKLGGWSIEKKMVEAIGNLISKGCSILEFGSGKGTEALLRKYKVTSIEHNKNYYYKRSKDHRIILAPIQDKWYAKDVVKLSMKHKYDLILVDGPPGKLREGILRNLDLFKNISIPIIFDDVNRKKDKDVLIFFCDMLNFDFQVVKGELKEFAICKKSVN